MKGYVLVLLGIAVGCAAGAAGVVPSVSVGQAGGARAVEQYCTDTGDFNNTEALNALVQKAGGQGWELVAVARAEAVGVSKADYVCFRRAR
jgi:hypothetical protein